MVAKLDRETDATDGARNAAVTRGHGADMFDVGATQPTRPGPHKYPGILQDLGL